MNDSDEGHRVGFQRHVELRPEDGTKMDFLLEHRASVCCGQPPCSTLVFHMVNDRIQRQIDRLLDQAEAAMGPLEWEVVRQRSQAVLSLQSDHGDAQLTGRRQQRLLANPNPRRLRSRTVPQPRPSRYPRPSPTVATRSRNSSAREAKSESTKPTTPSFTAM